MLINSTPGTSSSANSINALAIGGGYGGADDKSSVYIAASVAADFNMAVAEDVAKQAETVDAESSMATAADAYLSKPHVVTTDIKTRQDIEQYVVQEGDTVSSLAKKFNITSDTIRWANELNEDTNQVPVGKKLTILPVSGILHKVGQGDTAESLANHYGSNAQLIISFNDAELTGLKKGQKIVVPEGEKPAPAPAPTQSTPAAPTTTQSVYAGTFTPRYSGNGYSYGYCTWYAASRRKIPNNWGNANTWDDYARVSGYTVSNTPRVGAIAQTDGMSYWGHVGIVDDVRGNEVLVTDMNNVAGWGAVGSEWVPVSQYRYIW